MATKKTTQNSQPKVKGLSDTQRWVWGAILLCFAIFLALSTISFFIYWREDQDIAMWSKIFNGAPQEVLNWGGKLGASTANWIVNSWFGLFGLCIPIVLSILALRIMRFKQTLFRKSVRLTIILMVLGSVSLGYIFNENWGVFGSGLGGAQGIFVARWLNSVMGIVGTGLLLLLLWVIYAIYINRNTISVINRFGKDIVDNSRKVGEVVSTKATAAMQGNKESKTKQENEPFEEEEFNPLASSIINEPENQFIVRSTDEHIEKNNTRISETTHIDDDGFTIVDRSGMLRDTTSDTIHTAEGVTSEDPTGKIEVDENGFVVTNLGGEPTLKPIEQQEPLRQEVDENGFVIQYASGDQNTPLDETKNTDGFVAYVPDNTNLDETEGVTLERLPQDKLLSEEEIENTYYDPTLDLSSYQRPPIELLEDHSIEVSVTSEEIVENKNRIKDTLENFGIKIDKIKATIGPTVTLYEIVPAPGVRISKIKNLEDDIALSLSALGIRIIAPIPGKGTIGIEVPNKDKKIVSMYSVIKAIKFQESTFDIPIVLGKTIQDETFVIDLAKMPHLLVAGATGQGKSVGLNAIITSLLYKKHPSELKLVLVDPKKVELTLYSKLDHHFLAKMPGEDDAIITDTHKVIYTLNSVCIEMDSRYDLLRKAEVRHIKEYNEKFKKRRLNPNKGHRFLPYIIVIIDEFADLIMTAGREVETPIARIAQLARAVGIHLVIATQRPTTNIITGVIKANFPARIAFRVTSMIDSRTIIDQPGANQLIGRGDMLISTGNELIRVQCAFVDTPEIERITEFISNQRGYATPYELPEYSPEGADSGASGKHNDLSQIDAIFEDVARFVVQNQQGSTSSIQRRFSIGYNRAGRIMDQLEIAGVVGRAEGSKPREVLITDSTSLEKLLANIDQF